MAITLIGTKAASSNFTTGGTTITVTTLGLTLVTGDILVVQAVDGHGTGTCSFTCSGNNSGSATTVSNLFADNSGGNDTAQGVFLLIQGATVDTSITITASRSVSPGCYTVFQYRGVDTTTPQDVTATTATGQGVNDLSNPASITPTTSNAKIVVCYAGAQQSTTTWGTPTDVSNFVQSGDGSGAGGHHGRVACADKTWVSGAFNPQAIPTGDTNASTTLDSWAAVTLALRPAAGGGGGGGGGGTITAKGTPITGTMVGNGGAVVIDVSSLGLASGDFVIFSVCFNIASDIAALSLTGNVSGAFTNDCDLYANGTTGDVNGWSYSKRLTGADTSLSFGTTTNPTYSGSYVIRAYSGVLGFDATATTATGTTTDRANPPSITPVTTGAKIVAAYFGAQGANTAWTTPTGISNFSQTSVLTSGSGLYARVGSGDADWTTGAFDPAAITAGGNNGVSDSWGAITYALQPSSVGTTQPTFKSVGTFTATSTTSLSVPWGTHASGDFGVLVIAENSGTTTMPAGWTQIGSTFTTGTTRVMVGYKFATSSSEANVSVTGISNSGIAQIAVYQNVDSASPINVSTSGTQASVTTGTTVNMSAVTTTTDKCLVVITAFEDTQDSKTNWWTNWTNANLSSLSVRADTADTTGNGQGIAIVDGGKATAGSTGTTAATSASGNTSAATGWYVFALNGAVPRTQRYKIITSGTSFTVPSDWNSANNTIHCIGAAGITGTTTQGGAGGGYAASSNISLTPGASASCQVGVAGGTTTATGTANTWVVSNTTLRAGGGFGGAAGGATGNTVSVGTTLFTGGTTAASNSGGGGAAGPSGAGSAASGTTGGASNGSTIAGGTGGASPTAGSTVATWTDNSRTATDGLTAGPGSGGGGSTTAGVTGASATGYGGGAGVGPAGGGTPGNGVIVLQWYGLYPPPSITSAATHTIMPYSRYTYMLTAGEPVTWTITGGADQADFDLNGSVLTLSNPADPNSSKVVQVTATNSNGDSSIQTVTLNTLTRARRRVNGF
jgi:hypothetical protein